MSVYLAVSLPFILSVKCHVSGIKVSSVKCQMSIAERLASNRFVNMSGVKFQVSKYQGVGCHFVPSSRFDARLRVSKLQNTIS
jgi:hypothetical protein